MSIFVIPLVSLLGLIFGSFFTALVYRISSQESIMHGRSKCPKCNHVLGVVDLVPVFSFLWLRGKCRHCGKPISVYYPLVELGTVIYFLTGYLILGLTGSYLVYLIISTLLFLILVFDWRFGIIPDSLSLPTIVLVILIRLFDGDNWQAMILGGFIGLAFFAAQYFISHGRWVGDGDIRLGALMGVLLGVEKLWLALLLAYVGGAIIALLLMAAKRKTLKSQIPFGPFLVIATWVALLWGQPIITWYFSLMG